MENEKRVVELLAETLIKQDQMIDELKGSNRRLDNVENRLENEYPTGKYGKQA
jgi:hypothetical protein